MPPLTKRSFKGIGQSRMGSNAITNQPQGGGDKKAGFPYLVGRDSWAGTYMNYHSFPLKKWNTTIFPLASQTRPINSMYRSNYNYYKYPGVGKI
jgi:hypothetical protein